MRWEIRMGWDWKLGWDGDGRSSFQSDTALLPHDPTMPSHTAPEPLPSKEGDVDAVSPPGRGAEHRQVFHHTPSAPHLVPASSSGIFITAVLDKSQ